MQTAQTQLEPSPSPVPVPEGVTLSRSLLYFGAGFAAFSAIAYELLLASYATFLMGASIFQYSFVLSLTMASMGLGSLFTKNAKHPFVLFLKTESVLALLALCAIPGMYYAFSASLSPQLILIFFVSAIGFLVGMELPLLTEMLRRQKSLSTLLFYDYFGGFVGGIAFPLVLLPEIGFFRLGALLSAMNGGLAVAFTIGGFSQKNWNRTLWLVLSSSTFILSLVAYYFAESLRITMESKLFNIIELM